MTQTKEQICRNVINYCICLDLARASISQVDNTKKSDKFKVTNAIYEQVTSNIKKQAELSK